MLTGYKRKITLLDYHTHRIVQRHQIDAIPYPDMHTYRPFNVWDMEAFIFQDETRIGIFRLRPISNGELADMQATMHRNHVITMN